MPKSKKRKGHDKKVNNRNSLIKNNKRKQEKYQREQFDALLEQYEKQQQTEKELKNDNVPDIDQIEGVDGPAL
tara:strand:- start:89356 stop:89574 length:219 start_codon:yes stop_codon:yes gene_type:complete